MASTLDRVLAITSRFREERGGEGDPAFDATSAVCQDALIFGIDVDDYVNELEAEFGHIVREIPWLRFTDQTGSFRGCGCLLFPFWLIGRIPRLLVRKERLIPRPDPKHFPERLTLGHVSAVIDAGFWFEP